MQFEYSNIVSMFLDSGNETNRQKLRFLYSDMPVHSLHEQDHGTNCVCFSFNASPTQKTHLEHIKNTLKHINFYNTYLHVFALPIAIFYFRHHRDFGVISEPFWGNFGVIGNTISKIILLPNILPVKRLYAQLILYFSKILLLMR